VRPYFFRTPKPLMQLESIQQLGSFSKQNTVKCQGTEVTALSQL